MAEGVLGEIVSAKSAELAARFAGMSLDALRVLARPTRLGLASAIARPGARFVLEIKKASPSQGLIRGGADVAALARTYGAVADALSVLTDSAFFGGSLDDLRIARANFGGPILAKDFFVDPRQVVEARLAGADAILVMLSVLNDAEARAMIAEARHLGMDVLVEVHDESEMGRALALGAGLVGINNRNLRDLSIDLSTTERLAPLAPGRLLVSESGISTRTDVERLGGLVDGFLVGSALMRADNPGLAARELVFGRVKLCGLNTPQAVEAGAAASFAGFIFVPESPRLVDVDTGKVLAARARALGVRTVGVFRNAPADKVADTVGQLDLDAVQLHGAEDRAYVDGLRGNLPRGAEIWKAVSVGRDPLDGAGADRILFDHGDGGSGQAFDWRLVQGHPGLRESLIAGGIGAHNVRRAANLGAHAIDVGSSVESVPGRKSGWKVRALLEELRPTGREALAQCA